MSLLSTDPAEASVAKPVDALIEFLGGETGRLLDIGCGDAIGRTLPGVLGRPLDDGKAHLKKPLNNCKKHSSL